MVRINRRHVIAGAGALIASPRLALSQRPVTDSAGRAVAVPAKIERIFAAGGPAAVAVYVMRPDAMVGWPRANRDEEKPYLLPGVRDLPEVGMLTGRGDTANVEIVLKMKPDLVLDFGSVRGTFVSLADSTQQRTGIPYALVDGRFDATAASFRLLGDMLGVPERGAVLAAYTKICSSASTAHSPASPRTSVRAFILRAAPTGWKPASRVDQHRDHRTCGRTQRRRRAGSAARHRQRLAGATAGVEPGHHHHLGSELP